ncbi:MAG: tRNA (adenosine(37)-N6)-threonylcarbamoyltransferase complex ATPase subunit type 1 TsaE [Cyclobacteriaceae bacterium]
MTKEYSYDGLAQINGAARYIIENAGNHKVWLLDGEMGAGKTTLVKAIGSLMGIKDEISSPTYSLVNEYADENEKQYFHFDFYRIKDEEEAYDIGTDEYLYSGALCFIEWAEKIPSLIPDKYLEININLVSETGRNLILTHHDRTF